MGDPTSTTPEPAPRPSGRGTLVTAFVGLGLMVVGLVLVSGASGYRLALRR
ncbi:hypothetical protein [Oryzobacter telluris]|uniref:hypothetical protein n=1 Tax=Oryzobacter telluris TaxID=3149179 RepID=UPI00370D265C